MKRRKPAFSATHWLLAIGLPVVAAAVSWPLQGALISAHACATGQNGGGSIAVFAALVLVTPAVVVWHAWRCEEPISRAIPAALLGAGLALILMYVTATLWWSGHNCMT